MYYFDKTKQISSSLYQTENETNTKSTVEVQQREAGVAAPLHRCVLQHSLVKVKLSPLLYFSPVAPHREGRTQLRSYKTTWKSPESSSESGLVTTVLVLPLLFLFLTLDLFKFHLQHLTFLFHSSAGETELPWWTHQGEFDAIQR